ncbi:MAG: OmpA family protein [Draconibacterium sp.]
MKQFVLLLLGVIPMVLNAQNNCNFFEHRKIQIDKTNINTTQSDFGPAIVKNELWFSAYTNEEIKKLSQGETKGVFYNLYQSDIDAEGNVDTEKHVKFERLSEGYHAGPVSYCEKTGELFVTLSNFENPEIRNKVYRKAEIRLKIIITKMVNGDWQLTEEFPFNDSTYSVGHPAISVTGDTLFFASNKPGLGVGGTDLFMSVRSNGKWGNPVNLGNKINTANDEMFPFFFRGNMLFFASNYSEDGKKDFDMYYSCLSDGAFSNPVNLAELNTDADDFGLIIHPNEEFGYFTSQREGGLGDDDIYKVSFEGEYELELVVMDRKTMEVVPDPQVAFSDNIVGILSGLTVKRALGKNLNLLATSRLEGYQNSSVNITTVGKPYGTIHDTIWVEKVVVGQKFVMENIFYDFDKWDILPESEAELNKLVKIMNENPSWKVELGSHTDSRGSDSYNERLSQKRSDSAVAYIVEHGISKDRIIAKGYGESQLVNRCVNGVDCSDEEHRQNRRTEFKILEMDGM